MNAIERKAIEAALRKMFADGYFSICTIDRCLKLTGIAQGGRAYDTLNALHCVHFADMDREVAEAIPGLIAEVFHGVSFDMPSGGSKQEREVMPSFEDIEPTVRKRSGWLGLIGCAK